MVVLDVKPNLGEILDRLKQMDEELEEFDPEIHQMTFEDLKEKVDSIVSVKCHLEARIAYHKERMGEHKVCIDKMATSLDRLKKWVLFCLQSSGNKKLQGNENYVSITTNKKLDLFYNDGQIDSSMFVKYPDAIKREFVWDKVHIRDNIEKYGDIAKFEETNSVRMGVKK